MHLTKGYLIDFEPDPQAQDFGKRYVFGSKADGALAFDSREDCASQCNVLKKLGVTVPSKNGTVVCRDFRVEQRVSGDFVIWCEGPFVWA